MKEKIERWYLMNLWTQAMVKNAEEKGILNAEEVETILGKSH